MAHIIEHLGLKNLKEPNIIIDFFSFFFLGGEGGWGWVWGVCVGNSSSAI